MPSFVDLLAKLHGADPSRPSERPRFARRMDRVAREYSLPLLENLPRLEKLPSFRCRFDAWRRDAAAVLRAMLFELAILDGRDDASVDEGGAAGAATALAARETHARRPCVDVLSAEIMNELDAAQRRWRHSLVRGD